MLVSKKVLPVIFLLAGLSAPALADDAGITRTMQLVQQWVHGGYDNTAQAAADVAGNVPDALKHRVMYQLFVPVELPNIPGHTVYQQSSVDGSTDPDRITRSGILQFLPDPETGTVRERELNFKEPTRFHNAHLKPEVLADLTLEDVTWDPGCDFFLSTALDGQEVRGRIGVCRVPIRGTDKFMTADDEVVITPEQFWFLGRFKDDAGNIMWGNASDEHVRMLRTASLEEILRPDGGVLIFGATRNTGLEVARLLRARGETVTAFVRPNSDRTALQALGGVRLLQGDALSADDVRGAVTAARYSAILTTLGCFRCEADQRPDYIGNRNVFDAAKAANVRRVLMVSTLGAGDSADAPPFIAKWLLGGSMELKTQAENHLRGLDLDYTIIRPGGLKDAEPTGNGVLIESPEAMGIITRADLAQQIVDCLDDAATIGHSYAAVDTEMRWPWDMW